MEACVTASKNESDDITPAPMLSTTDAPVTLPSPANKKTKNTININYHLRMTWLVEIRRKKHSIHMRCNMGDD